jgi:hypothetical protein
MKAPMMQMARLVRDEHMNGTNKKRRPTHTIATRRPMICERKPKTAPPEIAPQLPMIVATVASWDEKPLLVLR